MSELVGQSLSARLLVRQVFCLWHVSEDEHSNVLGCKTDHVVVCEGVKVWRCEGVRVWALLWISMRTQRRESVPLKLLCLGNLTARPKLRGETTISTCPPLTSLHHHDSHSKLFVVYWRQQKQQRDSAGPGPRPGSEPGSSSAFPSGLSCVSLKSDQSKDNPLLFKRRLPSENQ